MLYSYEKCKLILNETDNYAHLRHPLVINWNINGQCQNKCIYCFSNDYIYMPDILSETILNNIINHIKSLNPLVVVISGGEPMLYPKIEFILDSLIKFCNVIIDTNGLCLDEKFILYCKNNKILIRISLDDYKPSINDNIRISSVPESTNIILNKINNILKLNANFIVHTVLSCKNIDSIIEFGKKLVLTGVRFWEIQVSIPYNGDKDILNKKIIEIEEFTQIIKDKMVIKIHDNKEDEKSIILINPKGEFLTRKTNSLEKEFIDLNNKYTPCIDALLKKIDLKNHFIRYTGEII